MLITSLRQGNVSVGTSDTVIGLLASASKSSLEKLNQIKGRSDKPYLLLIKSWQMVRNFAQVDDPALNKLITNAWPGPLTIIFKAKDSVPLFMKSKQNTVALRVPDHDGLQYVLNEVCPLFSTSANKADQPIPMSIDEI